jgi:hypothetical protein
VQAIESGEHCALTIAYRVAARQHRPEDASLAELAGDADAAALGLDDPPGQRQAETGALMRLAGRGIELVELGKEILQILVTDTFAVVLDLQTKPVIVLGAQPDRDARSRIE